MENLILRKSEKKNKRFDIVMPERGHVHSFGAKGGKTFIDGRTEKEKSAWEARHKRDKGYNIDIVVYIIVDFYYGVHLII